MKELSDTLHMTLVSFRRCAHGETRVSTLTDYKGIVHIANYNEAFNKTEHSYIYDGKPYTDISDAIGVWEADDATFHSGWNGISKAIERAAHG